VIERDKKPSHTTVPLRKTVKEMDLQKLAEEKEEVDFLEFTQIVNRYGNASLYKKNLFP